MGGRGAGGGGKAGGGGGGTNPRTGEKMASQAEINRIEAKLDKVKDKGWDKFGGKIDVAAKKYVTNSPQYHKARAGHRAWMKKNYHPLVKQFNKAKGQSKVDLSNWARINLT